MGKKRTPRGKVQLRERTEPLAKWAARRAGRKAPRADTGKAWPFTSHLKERVPLIYALLVQELRQPDIDRDPRIRHLIHLWQRLTRQQKRPRAIELTALAIQRAYRGAWEAYGSTIPRSEISRRRSVDDAKGISKGPRASFYRRYVQGHRQAVATYRQSLQDPRPWHRHHIGHEAYAILERPGSATRTFRLLPPKGFSTIPIMSLTRPDSSTA